MFPLGNGDILGLAIDCRLLQVYFFISDKLPFSFSAAHFILDRLPSCSVILFFEPSTGKNIPFAFIIIQSAQNVNGDQSEGRRCRPEKTDDTAGTLIWIRIDLLCVSCYNTHAKLYFRLQEEQNQKQKQPCKRGRKSVRQHWLFSFCIQNLSMW